MQFLLMFWVKHNMDRFYEINFLSDTVSTVPLYPISCLRRNECITKVSVRTDCWGLCFYWNKECAMKWDYVHRALFFYSDVENGVCYPSNALKSMNVKACSYQWKMRFFAPQFICWTTVNISALTTHAICCFTCMGLKNESCFLIAFLLFAFISVFHWTMECFSPKKCTVVPTENDTSV